MAQLEPLISSFPFPYPFVPPNTAELLVVDHMPPVSAYCPLIEALSVTPERPVPVPQLNVSLTSVCAELTPVISTRHISTHTILFMNTAFRMPHLFADYQYTRKPPL